MTDPLKVIDMTSPDTSNNLTEGSPRTGKNLKAELGTVKLRKALLDGSIHIPNSCKNVKRLNGDKAMVDDPAHLRCWMADLKM